MRNYSFPKKHWNWPVELSHQHGVRCNGMVFTGGQADLDAHGNVIHPGDLEAQTKSVFRYVRDILNDLDTNVKDLVRLVIYFVGDAKAEETILEILSKEIASDLAKDTASHTDSPRRPTVSTICLPALCYPGMLIELEAIAMHETDAQSHKSLQLDTLPALHTGFAHVVRCNDLIFTSDLSSIDNNGNVTAPSDLITQTSIMMEQLTKALAAVGATTEDVLKLNVFYKGDGTAENWEQPARIRADYFPDPGPAATGITTTHFAQSDLMTKIAVCAGIASSKTQYSWPDGHWDWTTTLPYKHGNKHPDKHGGKHGASIIHLGGQVALDINAEVLHPGDIVAQTKIALQNIQTILQDLGATMNDVVKVTTFYQGSASAEGLHQNLTIRSDAFDTPGPATSGIPVPHLVYENMMIEIEIIAITE